jgi:hypothetical protein
MKWQIFSQSQLCPLIFWREPGQEIPASCVNYSTNKEAGEISASGMPAIANAISRASLTMRFVPAREPVLELQLPGKGMRQRLPCTI